MIVAKVTEVAGEYNWLDLSVTVNKNTTYLSEDEYLDAFVGTVTVDSRSIILLNNTYSGATLTVEVWLQPLAIGQFNDYYLSDIQISSTTSREIALDGVSGTYTVIVESYDIMEPGAVIMVNGTALTRNPDMFGAWTGSFDLTGKSSLVLSTTNEEVITVNLSLREYVTVNEELPMDEYAEFSIYEPQTFVYQAIDTGYFSLSYTSNVADAVFAIEIQEDPNSFKWFTIQGENYPLYMVENQYYYVTVTYMGTPWELGVEMPETVEAIFAVEDWIKPTLEVDYLYTYVPITAAGEPVVEIPMNIEAGIYNLDLDGIPFYVLKNNDYTITAHFGTKSVELDLDYAQIEIFNEKSIWFTTNCPTGFSAGVTINPATIIETINLGEWTPISVPAGESRVFYIDNIEEGYFNITLQNIGSASIVVEASTSGYPIVPAGQTSGTFRVVIGDVTTVALYFYNYSDFDAYFEALVFPEFDVVIELGEVKGIELVSGETRVYYVEDLSEGLYNIALANAAGIKVTANGMPVTDGRFVTNYDGESVALRFTNTGANTASFEVTVTMIANGVIALGEEMHIFMDASNNVKTYVVEGLEESKEYKITLSDYATDVIVMMGNTTVIKAGATTGTFTATGTSVTLTFVYYCCCPETFSVLITEEILLPNPDIIQIGVAKDIALTTDNSAHIYYIEGVTKGLYRVDLTGNVKQIQVIVGNQVVVFYGDSQGYFEYLSKTSADLTVIVSYNGKSTLSFSLTVTKEDDNLLPLGVKRTIEMSKAENVKQYYLEDLSKGQYKITLTLSNGTEIEILTLNGIIISYGDNVGYFDVQTSVDRLNLIFAYNGSSEVTFTVLVTAVN